MTRKRYNVRLRLAATVVAAVLSLSGCTFQEMDRMSRKAQASGDIAREHVSEQMRSSQGALVWTDKPWVNLKPVPTVSRDTPLENFPDCQITLARDGLTLPEIGERITALCGVRVIFSPDALAVGQSSGTTRALNGPLPTPDNNGRIPLDQLGGAVDRAGVTATPLVLSGLRWQGKLSGLLDMIAARTGLTPRMDNGAILFSLLETRTFQFTFLNTNITSNASVTSGSTSSMGTSGGTTNSSVSGDSSSSQQTTVDQSRNVYDDMKKTLETMLTPQKGRFWLSASTGTLTVTDNVPATGPFAVGMPADMGATPVQAAPAPERVPGRITVLEVSGRGNALQATLSFPDGRQSQVQTGSVVPGTSLKVKAITLSSVTLSDGQQLTF
ncbi:type IV pilus biogenesis protein PilP [Salmonella enterica]|nr:type IV pilus biogenesis protein PilP [Salmonella enterica]